MVSERDYRVLPIINPIELSILTKRQDLDAAKNTIFAIMALSIALFHALIIALMSIEIGKSFLPWLIRGLNFTPVLIYFFLCVAAWREIKAFIVLMKEEKSVSDAAAKFVLRECVKLYEANGISGATEAEGYLSKYIQHLTTVQKNLEEPKKLAIQGFLILLTMSITLLFIKG